MGIRSSPSKGLPLDSAACAPARDIFSYTHAGRLFSRAIIRLTRLTSLAFAGLCRSLALCDAARCTDRRRTQRGTVRTTVAPGVPVRHQRAPSRLPEDRQVRIRRWQSPCRVHRLRDPYCIADSAAPPPAHRSAPGLSFDLCLSATPQMMWSTSLCIGTLRSRFVVSTGRFTMLLCLSHVTLFQCDVTRNRGQ